MTNVEDRIVSAQLCIGNALEEVDKLAQLVDADGQEALNDARGSLHQAMRRLANIEVPGPVTARQINLKQIMSR